VEGDEEKEASERDLLGYFERRFRTRISSHSNRCFLVVGCVYAPPFPRVSSSAPL
jgi:hypothetical protein